MQTSATQPNAPNNTPNQSLRPLRIIWAAILFGQIAFAAIIASLLNSTSPPNDHSLFNTLFPIAIVITVLAIPIALFIRGQIYKRNWQSNAISPQGYFSATITFLAILEGASFFCLVTMLVTHSWLPGLLVILLFALQLINFPTGRPLQPSDQLHIPQS